MFDKLKTSLLTCGQVFRPRNQQSVLDMLNQTQRVNYAALCKTFLQHAKSNELAADALHQKSQASDRKFRERLFLRIMAKLMTAYANRQPAAQ